MPNCDLHKQPTRQASLRQLTLQRAIRKDRKRHRKKEQQKYNRERKVEKPQYDKERGKEEKRETPRKKGRGEKLNS